MVIFDNTKSIKSILIPVGISDGLMILRDLFILRFEDTETRIKFMTKNLLLTSLLAFITDVVGDSLFGTESHELSLVDTKKIGLSMGNGIVEITLFTLMYTSYATYSMTEVPWITHIISSGLIYAISMISTDLIITYT